MKRITLKGGPRDGRSFDVPHEYTAIAYPGGEYRIKGNVGTWRGNDTRSAAAKAKQYDEGGPIPAGKVNVVVNKSSKPETTTKPIRARK